MHISKLVTGSALALAIVGFSPAGSTPAQAAMSGAARIDGAVPAAEPVTYGYRRYYRGQPGFYFHFGTPRQYYGYNPYRRHYGYYPNRRYHRYYRSW